MKLNHLLDNDRPVKTKTHLIHAKTRKNACENWRKLRFCFMKLGPVRHRRACKCAIITCETIDRP